MTRHQPRGCGKTLQLLDDFISGELSVESNREILSHLEHCASCDNEQQAREQMRESLRQAWHNQPVPDGLKGRIVGGLDGSPGVLRYLRRAAGFIVATLALYLVWQFFPLTASAVDHYYQALRDHFQCQEVAQQPPLPIAVTSPEIDQALASLPDEYELTMGHYCQAEGVEFFHYNFRSRSSRARFSVVIEARAPREILAQREDLVRQVIGSLDVSILHGQEATVFALETEGYFVYLVSQEKEREQAQLFARALLPTLENLL
ncbi:MAG TPA: zf-HC2 domain-containing protein [Acidobacteriota bacterium]|nr:zf-HC2 domain-containing protein [Acidobacteriota bacterium]